MTVISRSSSERKIASLFLTNSERPMVWIAYPPVDVASTFRTSHSASRITTRAPGATGSIIVSSSEYCGGGLAQDRCGSHPCLQASKAHREIRYHKRASTVITGDDVSRHSIGLCPRVRILWTKSFPDSSFTLYKRYLSCTIRAFLFLLKGTLIPPSQLSGLSHTLDRPLVGTAHASGGLGHSLASISPPLSGGIDHMRVDRRFVA